MAKTRKSFEQIKTGKVIEVIWGNQDLPPLRAIIRTARKFPHLKAYQTNDEILGGAMVMFFAEDVAAIKRYIKKQYPDLKTPVRICAMTDELY